MENIRQPLFSLTVLFKSVGHGISGKTEECSGLMDPRDRTTILHETQDWGLRHKGELRLTNAISFLLVGKPWFSGTSLFGENEHQSV